MGSGDSTGPRRRSEDRFAAPRQPVQPRSETLLQHRLHVDICQEVIGQRAPAVPGPPERWIEPMSLVPEAKLQAGPRWRNRAVEAERDEQGDHR